MGHNFDRVLCRSNFRPTPLIHFFGLLLERELLEFFDIEIDTFLLIEGRCDFFELSHHRHSVFSLHINFVVEVMEGLDD